MSATLRLSEEDAVSPVIGVILMVAVGVVLSAVVFVVASGIGGKTIPDAPTPVMQVDDIGDRLTVLSATVGADWSRVQISATRCTTGGIVNVGSSGTSHQNQPASAAATYTAISNSGCTGISPRVTVAPVSTVINAGDYLAFCTSGGTAANVDIQLMDTVANTVLGTYSLTSLHAC
ncbi:MAG: Archaeal Type pilin, N-terminal [Thermoplasmata archaeon]|jgi:FlaG/FlaF family flagellin (archaellin)|nr:Archaeal Type pilin, N-terminal [Thermoplasmata archaeon]